MKKLALKRLKDKETDIKEGTEDNTQAFCKTFSSTI